MLVQFRGEVRPKSPKEAWLRIGVGSRLDSVFDSADADQDGKFRFRGRASGLGFSSGFSLVF